MMLTVATKDVIERLKRLQSTHDLPNEAQKTAKTLISRLSSPVRITLFGPVGAGKSTLRDVLAGAAVVPDGQNLPTTLLQHGDCEKIKATLGDRSVETIEGLDFTTLQKLSPAYVEVCAPLKVLKEFSLLEVVTDGSPRELKAATKWAASRTDITIWVTTEFGAAEQAIWATVADEVQDHAYLVLNQVDLLRPEPRETRREQMEAVASQSFRSFFATSALSARTAAETGNGDSDRGCKSLLRSLKRHVNLASQTDIDGALMFLNRFEASEKSDMRAKEKTSASHIRQTADKDKEAKALSQAGPISSVEKFAIHDAGQDGTTNREAREKALVRLRACANGMLLDWSNLAEPLSETVLDRCVETVEDLAEALSREDQFYEPVLQVSDLIVLLHLEKSDAAAENAVTALLQLKRDFEVALAA